MSKETKEVPLNKGIEANATSSSVNVEAVVLKDGSSFFVIRNVRGELFKVCSTVDELSSFFSELINLGKNESEK